MNFNHGTQLLVCSFLYSPRRTSVQGRHIGAGVTGVPTSSELRCFYDYSLCSVVVQMEIVQTQKRMRNVIETGAE